MGFQRFLKKATGNDDAVYWPPNLGTDGYGQYTNSTPTGIKCRWEDLVVDFVDREGKIEQSKAVIYLYGVDIKFGGILWHGKLSDANANPFKNDGALEIRQLKDQGTFKNEARLTTVYLA